MKSKQKISELKTLKKCPICKRTYKTKYIKSRLCDQCYKREFITRCFIAYLDGLTYKEVYEVVKKSYADEKFHFVHKLSFDKFYKFIKEVLKMAKDKDNQIKERWDNSCKVCGADYRHTNDKVCFVCGNEVVRNENED